MPIACWDVPHEKPGPRWASWQGVLVVPSFLHPGYCQTFPFDQVEQAWALATVIKLAVEDPIDLPLIRIGQLDWWWGVDYPVGDVTRTGGLQQRYMEDRVDTRQRQGQTKPKSMRQHPFYDWEGS